MVGVSSAQVPASQAYDALVGLLKAHATTSEARAAAAAAKKSNKLPPQKEKRAAAAPAVHTLLVIVLEEIDRLLDKGPDEVYRLFMLPHVPGEAGTHWHPPAYTTATNARNACHTCSELHTYIPPPFTLKF